MRAESPARRRRQMQAAESDVTERLDHLGVVAGVCQEIGGAAW